MTTTNVIDLTDFTATIELPRIEHDDTVLIPTYNGAPMLPPVPARRPLTVRPKHRAPSHRAAWLLGAVTLGGMVAPAVLS